MLGQGFVLTGIFRDGTIRPRMLHQPVINGLEFARTGSTLQGSYPVADFVRLRDVLSSDEGMLEYELQGVREVAGYPALRLKVSGAVQLLCQRCLEAIEHDMRINVLLQLAATQAEVDAEPMAAEGPERIAAGREMPVRDLVEDELLLAVPLAPRHARCGMAGSRSLKP
ncbi:MAG: DUF177 domain-containing protein [Candidatus Parcubacteria bacterium]|nr:DUF177 domain-containing protein [Burkholderiales bacterium]